jgi:hypothetical protein
MTREHNPHTLAAAAKDVLKTLGDGDTDMAFCNEVQLELELIEQGYMDMNESILEIDRWDDPRFLSITIDRLTIPSIVINVDTGEVTYDQLED